MQLRIIGLFAVLLLVCAIAGCAGVQAPTATPGQTAAPVTAQYLDGKAVFNLSGVKWVEYRVTSATKDGSHTDAFVNEVQMQFDNETLDGIAARHVRAAFPTGEGDLHYDYYYDPATLKVLEASVYAITLKGQSSHDVPTEGFVMSFDNRTFEDPVLAASPHMFKLIGEEKVSIPLSNANATYWCSIYRSDDGSVTVWADERIPVPVKMEKSCGADTTTIELLTCGKKG